jgi:hypothetical protein
MPPGPGTITSFFATPVAVHTLGESVTEGVLLGRRRRWTRRGLLSRCRERQPGSHPQPEARELLASAWIDLSMGVALAGSRFSRIPGGVRRVRSHEN